MCRTRLLNLTVSSRLLLVDTCGVLSHWTVWLYLSVCTRCWSTPQFADPRGDDIESRADLARESAPRHLKKAASTIRQHKLDLGNRNEKRPKLSSPWVCCAIRWLVAPNIQSSHRLYVEKMWSYTSRRPTWCGINTANRSYACSLMAEIPNLCSSVVL